MAKPSHKPTFDTDLTNVNEPVSGLKSDGWATDDVVTSSNLNWLFAYLSQWIDWVDAGAWTCITIVVSGAGTFASLITGALTVTSGATSGDAATFTGGAGDAGMSSPNGGKAGIFNGGTADAGGAGGAALFAAGGLNGDGVTYAEALKAPHGGVTLQDGGLSATKDLTTSAGNITATAGNVTAGGTGSAIGIPARITTGLTNLWANIGGTAEVFGYWKNAFGEVSLDGLLDASAATSHVIATLNTGFGPLKDEYFDVLDTFTGAVQRIVISASARTITYNGTIGSAANVSLAGIRFRTT